MIRNVCLLSILAAGISWAGLTWKSLPELPDEHGFAGAFAGNSGSSLIVAGGANFPDGAPWDGGLKIWHDQVFALEKGDSSWSVAGKLPRPLGYG
ncbi:MAG: galactose oxidase, partial [Luteolibacter sp.]